MKEELYYLENEEETKQFGLQLANHLKPGSVVALTGDLGTGKTTLTQYLALGLGIGQRVTSPTFTIIKEYHEGKLPLYHFDVYRIQEEELWELGYEEYIDGKGVTVIEWADKIGEHLPEEAIRIHITPGEHAGSRLFHVWGIEGRIL
jgi:tRNA threonylcarbamoyladenosine biosynthesis protein TsaE